MVGCSSDGPEMWGLIAIRSEARDLLFGLDAAKLDATRIARYHSATPKTSHFRLSKIKLISHLEADLNAPADCFPLAVGIFRAFSNAERGRNTRRRCGPPHRRIRKTFPAPGTRRAL